MTGRPHHRRAARRWPGAMAALMLVAAFESYPFHAQVPPKQAVVETSAGTFIVDLAPADAPNHVAYFTKARGSRSIESF